MQNRLHGTAAPSFSAVVGNYSAQSRGPTAFAGPHRFGDRTAFASDFAAELLQPTFCLHLQKGIPAAKAHVASAVFPVGLEGIRRLFRAEAERSFHQTLTWRWFVRPPLFCVRYLSGHETAVTGCHCLPPVYSSNFFWPRRTHCVDTHQSNGL